MDMGKTIKMLRERNGWTQEQLGEKLGIKRAAINKYEKGDVENMKRKMILQLSNIFDVSPSYLLSGKEEKIDDVPFTKIPVVSKISAGMPLFALENIIEHTYISDAMVKNGMEYFGLIVQGDSMDREFKEDDIVIVEKGTDVENGQIGVFAINGFDATVKRVRHADDSILLLPESNNSVHEPQIYTPDDHIEVIGKVVGLNRRY